MRTRTGRTQIPDQEPTMEAKTETRVSVDEAIQMPKRRRAKVEDVVELPAQEVAVDSPPPRRRRVIAPDETQARIPESEPTTSTPVDEEPRVPLVKGEELGAPAPTTSSLRMGGGFDAIIDSVFNMDAETDYKRIMASLISDMKPSRAEYGMLVDALDNAEENARKAHQIVANGIVARKTFEAEADAIEASLREAAIKIWENKTDKKPTIADIQSTMISAFHDEWRELATAKAKGLALIGYLEGMSKAVQERAKDLRQMVAGAQRH